MICDAHFTYHELIKDVETHLEKAPISSELIELIEKATEEALKNYDTLIVLASVFDPLVARLNKIPKKSIERLSQDEGDFIIKLLIFLKLLIRSLDNRKTLLEMGLTDILVGYIEENELKSSKDDERKVMIVSLCMFLFNSFCVLEEERLGNLLDRVYKATWSYLSMNVSELQHQTLAFLWTLLNNKDSKHRLRLRGETKFLMRRFNEYKEQWSTQTLELFIAFFASVLFIQEKGLYEGLQEDEKKEVSECIEYLDQNKLSLSSQGRYFADRAINFLHPLLIEKELKEEEEAL